MLDREAPASRRGGGDAAVAVLEAIRAIRYGSVEITIHDGRIVGLERREKVRFDKDLGR